VQGASDVEIVGFTHNDTAVYYQTRNKNGKPETTLKRVALAGAGRGAPEELARSGRSDSLVVAGSFVYWIAPRADLSANDLVRLPKTGGRPEVIAHATDYPMRHLTADDAVNVYFANFTTRLGAGAAKIVRIAPDRTRTVLVTDGEGDAWSFAVAEDVTFWTPSPQAGHGAVFSDALIYARESDGRASRVIYGPVPESYVNALAVDETKIFFARQHGVFEMPRGGGSPTTIAEDDASEVVLDHGTLYWLTRGEYVGTSAGVVPRKAGTIVRSGRSRGAGQVVTDDLVCPRHFEVDRWTLFVDSRVGNVSIIIRVGK